MDYTYPFLNSVAHILSLDGEVWEDIPSFEGFYKASNYGRIKRLACSRLNSNQTSKYIVEYSEIILKASNDSKGYPQVVLANPKRRVARIHRLVAEAFLEPPSDILIEECTLSGLDYVLVNHRDENTENSFYKNLEWCSPLYNNMFGTDRKGNPKTSGSANVHSKATETDVLAIVELLKTGSLSQECIAAKFNLQQITVSNIWTGRSWSHLTGIPWKARSKRKGQRQAKAIAEQVFKYP